MVSRVILNHCNGEQATQITPYVFKYDPVNNTYFPNSCTIMPQGTMHGGPPSSLLLFEAIKALNEANENPSTDQWNIVKFYVNLMKGVPINCLKIKVTLEKQGRRVMQINAEMFHEDVKVAYANGTALKKSILPPPRWTPTVSNVPNFQHDMKNNTYKPKIDEKETADDMGKLMDILILKTKENETKDALIYGPKPAWFRMKFPLVEGYKTPIICRAMLTADFGSGYSMVYLSPEQIYMINPDLEMIFDCNTVDFHEDVDEETKEWIHLNAVQTVDVNDGYGIARTTLSAANGKKIGTVVASLIPSKWVFD